jgi:hypothetical protein
MGTDRMQCHAASRNVPQKHTFRYPGTVAAGSLPQARRGHREGEREARRRHGRRRRISAREGSAAALLPRRHTQAMVATKRPEDPRRVTAGPRLHANGCRGRDRKHDEPEAIRPSRSTTSRGSPVPAVPASPRGRCQRTAGREARRTAPRPRCKLSSRGGQQPAGTRRETHMARQAKTC